MYYKSTTLYYSVLQSATPVPPRTESTTPVLLCTTKCYSQNDRFLRGFLQISQTKLPKGSFRARLPTILTEEASKMIVSCEASSKFHRTSFQKDRFARGFRQFSQTELPKGSFRARLPPNFIEQSNQRFARGFFKFSQNNASKTQSLTTPGQCAEQFLQVKICISPQFRATDPPNPMRGFILQNQNARLATTACHPQFQHVRFATAACAKMYAYNARRPRQPAPYKNHRFTTVSDVRPARSDERVAPATSKSAFHHSFGRPMSRKRRKGRAGHFKICISPQFWTSDDHEVTSGLLRRRANFAFHHSFGCPTTTK